MLEIVPAAAAALVLAMAKRSGGRRAGLRGEAMQVNAALAMHVCDRHPAIPRAKRVAHQLWKIVALAVLIGGPVYAFWGGWYWALGGLILGGLLIAAVRRSAAEFVLETAEGDPAFREEMIRAGVLAE